MVELSTPRIAGRLTGRARNLYEFMRHNFAGEPEGTGVVLIYSGGLDALKKRTNTCPKPGFAGIMARADYRNDRLYVHGVPVGFDAELGIAVAPTNESPIQVELVHDSKKNLSRVIYRDGQASFDEALELMVFGKDEIRQLSSDIGLDCKRDFHREILNATVPLREV